MFYQLNADIEAEKLKKELDEREKALAEWEKEVQEKIDADKQRARVRLHIAVVSGMRRNSMAM